LAIGRDEFDRQGGLEPHGWNPRAPHALPGQYEARIAGL
jgi:hypothetical protein